MLNAELLTSHIWFKNAGRWMPIQATNTWPANTRCVLAWRVKNTGDITGTFKARFWGRDSDKSFVLEPDKDVLIYFGFTEPYIHTPGLGDAVYTLEILANDVVIGQYNMHIVTVGEELPLEEERPFPFMLVGGITLAVIVIGIIAKRRK